MKIVINLHNSTELGTKHCTNPISKFNVAILTNTCIRFEFLVLHCERKLTDDKSFHVLDITMHRHIIID